MATRGKSSKDTDYIRGKNSKKKSSPAFVPLDGLSQSAKDRLMNNRTVKPPRNLNSFKHFIKQNRLKQLIEGDPGDGTEFQKKSRQMTAFPNEHLLSSRIKEANGMDHSNHSIEQFFRNCHSRSTSPDVSENSTISSSEAKEGVQRNATPEEGCTPTYNCSTGVESSNAESEPDEMDAILKSRYSKNAAIIGMLKNNYISLDDLTLNDKGKKNYHYGDDGTDIQEIVGDKSGKDNPKNVHGYPHLVPHRDDPDFFTIPLLADGKVDDAHIDYGIPRKGKKTSTTSRSHFINAGLNDDAFRFPTKSTTETYKPKLNINLPKINPSCSRDQTYCNGQASNSYDSLRNDEDDGFKMNREEFPTLGK